MSGPLAVSLTADISAYQRSMARAGEIAARHAQDIAGNFQTAAKVIDTSFAALQTGQGLSTLARLPQLARTAILAFAGFEAIKLALREAGRASEAARERLEELAKIARQAQGAGVGTTFLQSLTGQAKALGTETQSLVGMLERAREAATVRIGEVDTAASSAILDRLRQNVKAGNLGQVDLNRYTNAESQEARIRVILDLIDQLRAEGADLAALDLAGRMFGSEFETKLRTGTDMIGAMRRALDGLSVGANGRIISPDEIARAESMKRQLAEIEDKLSNALRPIQQDIALWEQQQLQGWIDIKAQLAEIVVIAGQLYSAFKSVGDYISSLGSAKPFVALRDWLDSVGMLDHEGIARMNRQLNGGLDPTTPTEMVPKDADVGGPLKISVKPKRDTSRPLPSLSAPKAAGGSATELDEIERFINALDKSTVSLKAQVDAFHLSNSEQAVTLQLARAQEIAKQANRTLTEEETRRIREAAMAASTYKDKLVDLQQQQNQTAELARTLGNALSDSFADAILEGESLGDVLSSLAKQLARMAIQAAFTGQGPLAGLFETAPAASQGSSAVGGLIGMVMKGFAGGFADGGVVQGPGGPREDRVVARLSPGEFVVNAASTAKHRAVLEAINAGKLPAFASGGLVRPGSSITMPKGAASPGASQVITIAPAITIQTNGGGTPAQNADLAQQTANAARSVIEGIVDRKLRKALRPGNQLNS